MASNKNQYLGTLCVNLLSMVHGAVCGWPSAGTLLLTSDETPLASGKITMEQASWIAAVLAVGSLFGNIVFGWITERFGRKKSLLLAAVPQIFSWLLILLATNVSHLYWARILAGVSGGGAFVIIPLYVAEISDNKIRGTLGSCMVLSCNTGILLIFLLGHYATYEFAPKVFIGLGLVFLCTFPFFPESPQYLLKINKEEEAEKSLYFYRGVRADENSECESLQVELKKLKSTYSDMHGTNTTNTALTLDDFKSREAKRSLIIALSLITLNQMCGCFSMVNYTATIFVEAGSSMEPNLAAIFVGATQLLGSYLSLVLVDRTGRKFLLTVSAVGIGLGQICLGLYTILKEQGVDMTGYGWITVASFSFVIFIAACGVLTVPFLVIAEILPEKIRNFGSALAISWLSILAFGAVKMFPLIAATLGMGGSMFLYATISFLGAIFVMVMVPETKNCSFEQIAELLRK